MLTAPQRHRHRAVKSPSMLLLRIRICKYSKLTSMYSMNIHLLFFGTFFQTLKSNEITLFTYNTRIVYHHCRGQSPRWGVWGPQKLKPKNDLDASQKAFGDTECQVCPSEPTLNLCIILVLVGMLQPVCRPTF